MIGHGTISRGLQTFGTKVSWLLLVLFSIACVNNAPPKIETSATDDNSQIVPLPGGFTLISAVGGNSSISLSWTSSLNASKYEVSYRRLDQSEYTSAGETASTSTVIPGLVDGVVYAVKVIATNRTGIIFSNETHGRSAE